MDDIKYFIEKLKDHRDLLHLKLIPNIDEDVLKYGLTKTHYAVMFNLLKREGMPILTEVAKQLSITYPTMTNIVDHLESKKLVLRKRDGKDRRAIRMCLTKRGAELINRIDSDWKKKFGSFINELAEPDRKVLLKAADTIINIMLKYNGSKPA
jgi:DNA-binding MarR family transcriptional regulator